MCRQRKTFFVSHICVENYQIFILMRYYCDRRALCITTRVAKLYAFTHDYFRTMAWTNNNMTSGSELTSAWRNKISLIQWPNDLVVHSCTTVLFVFFLSLIIFSMLGWKQEIDSLTIAFFVKMIMALSVFQL